MIAIVVLIDTGLAVSATAQRLTLVTNPPPTGTFYSLSLLQAPFPFNPFPELAVYSTGDGAFVYDDRSIDYVSLRAEMRSASNFSASSVLLGGGGEMMSLSSPPPPGGGGGGGGGGGMSNPPPYSAPGLKLTIPVLTNGALLTSVFESDTNSAYDLFERFAFQPATPWARIASTEIGGTNFAVSQASPNAAYYLAANTTDSDFDGLSDAYESLVSQTQPLLADTDTDGLPDGAEDFNNNGVPDRYDYALLTRAVVFASRTNAFEGGESGEVTIQLPTAAPPGGLNKWDGLFGHQFAGHLSRRQQPGIDPDPTSARHSV